MAAASSSSSPFFGTRDEVDHLNQVKQQQQQQQSSSPTAAAPAPAAAPPKKRRNLPGNPTPDAEVIALSPKTLMATNRFICEVCNKGFQREQNLQLHRRGHNLPWKLRQKNPKEVRRKVYLCPEPTCVHHDPSRALGDLTGIKKHFCRKHGEKKWKCEKCSKRYAVQSDWKAHSKTCGTREYRCDCGTLFSRRDSFITHRAFCDALAQESGRLPTSLSTIGGHLYGNNSNMALGLSQMNSQLNSIQEQGHPSSDILRLGRGGGGSQFDHLMSPSSGHSSFGASHPPLSSPFFLGAGSNQGYGEEGLVIQSKPFHGLIQLPELQPNTNSSTSTGGAGAANMFNLSFFSNGNGTSNNNINSNNNAGTLLMSNQFNNGNEEGEAQAHYNGNLMNAHHLGMSTLFHSSMQNESMIPQMSATALLQKAAQMGSTSSSGTLLRGIGSGGGGGGDNLRSQMESSETHFHDIMNSLNNGNTGMFAVSGGLTTFGGNCTSNGGHQEQVTGYGGFGSAGFGQSDGVLTRDFLGVGSLVRTISSGINQRDQQHHSVGSLAEPEVKPSSSSRSFAS